MKDETINDLNNRQRQLDQELGLKITDVDKRKKQVKDVSKELLKVIFGTFLWNFSYYFN